MTVGIRFLQQLFLLVILFQLEPRVADSNNMIRCIDEEREALLTFKESLVDESGVLSSWGPEDEKRDCCKWTGVGCSNRTGHVIKLEIQPIDFDSFPLRGTISPALLQLHRLTYLDLSLNNFSGSPIPEFIGSLTKLSYLDLSFAEFEGPIPSHLGNLSALQHLDLSLNHLFSVGNLDWLWHLSSLTYLDLGSNNLSRSTDWLQVVGNLPLLTTLYLYRCHLPPIVPLSLLNLNYSTSLQFLELSENNLTNSIYPWLFNASSNLVLLGLDSNHLRGSIPVALKHIVSLSFLGLASNEFEGGVPDFFGNMCSLTMLNISDNKLRGHFPELIQNLSKLYLENNRLNGFTNNSIGQMSNLRTLSLNGNSLIGVISEAFFSNLSSLTTLNLADNNLSLEFSNDWIPPFQLNFIHLRSCKMGPHFPKWLQTQNQVKELDISDAGISDTIPDWFWNQTNELFVLNISNNQIQGKLPDLSMRFDTSGSGIDISSNHFEGPIPALPTTATFLNLSKNKFSGTMSIICSMDGNNLLYLDLSSNFLSGRLPGCWMQFDGLGILNLANNNFSGNIPDSIGFLRNILTLSLYNNSLTGELPSSLKNCSQLRVMDLGNNELSGEIPPWIGEGLSKLVVLSVTSNQFHGNMPFQLCRPAYIQVLDLSLNHMSGIIPKCFNNLTAMTQETSSNPTISMDYYFIVGGGTATAFSRYSSSYFDNVLLTWKGNKYRYKNTLGLVKILDLSNNKLGGSFPEEIMDLVGLVALNLSRNHLTGQIRPKIGQLKSLDFLDLSKNLFFGGIPASLSQLSGLSVMDLSYNNLSGKIPLGTQLQSFNASVYAGNPELCGLPLPNKCPNEDSASGQGRVVANTPEDEDEDEFITLGFYISLILGFFTGFWGFCSAILVNSSWRRSYFNFLTGVKNWVYVTVAVKIDKLKRRFRN
ncbi:hypothetical protein CUMW_090600 [Citrus unshiu]|nr:hypothetical protein CUMW_090600 [Citrus unshiu]